MTNLEKKRVRELLSLNSTLVNELVFSPLEAWTDDDVWVFLMQYKNPWGYSNMELLTMYKGATADNECPLMVDKDLPSLKAWQAVRIFFMIRVTGYVLYIRQNTAHG